VRTIGATEEGGMDVWFFKKLSKIEREGEVGVDIL
jgi:hypothetical protein